MEETETTYHLCCCLIKVRRGLLDNGIIYLRLWMENNDMYVELQEWISVYLSHQGHHLFADLEQVEQSRSIKITP